MKAWESSPAELFPDGDFAFHLTLRRVGPGEFLRRSDASGAILRERARWIESAPDRYVAVGPGGSEAVEEFAHVAARWTDVSPAGTGATGGGISWVGRAFEPDILFLTADARGEFRLAGGALCFPTGWALTEKLGHTVETIHGVVPGLNPALGRQIGQLLAKLRTDVAYVRQNWGLAATDELNHHPARGLPAPTSPVRLNRLWLRVEHQALFALPQTRAVVFAIRISHHRLDQLPAPAAAGLRRALATMPSELISYKRLGAIRADVMDLL